MSVLRFWLQILCLSAGVGLASWALVTDRAGLAQPTPEGKKQQAQIGSIDDTKKKGFEGVDFSYDVFGAPSGQDATDNRCQAEQHHERAKQPEEFPRDVVQVLDHAGSDSEMTAARARSQNASLSSPSTRASGAP